MLANSNDRRMNSAQHKINVDLDFLRKTYFTLRNSLLQEITKNLNNNNDNTDLNEEKLIQQMDIDLTSTMINIILNCNIVDLPNNSLDLTDSKTVHHLLIKNSDMLDIVPKDLNLQENLQKEFEKFDDLCVKKSDLLKELSKFNTSVIMSGSNVSEQYLLDIDTRIGNILNDVTDIESYNEDDTIINGNLKKQLVSLAESMHNINTLETNGSLKKLEEKFITLQSKVEFLIEKLDK